MIIKGQSFTFVYEARDASTGALVPTAGTSGHTVVIYYSQTSDNTVTWSSYTLCSSEAPTSYSSNLSDVKYVGSDTGVYFCTIPASVVDDGTTINITNSDHIVISVAISVSGGVDVIVPLQQFYPVDLSRFATPQSIWNYGNSESPIAIRTLSSSTNSLDANGIADAVWGGDRSTRTLTSASVGSSTLSTGSFPVASDIANAVWGGDRTVRKLTSNVLDNISGASLALSGESSVSVGDNNGNNETITASEIATAVLAGVPDAVWSMTVNGDSYSRMARIADYVWGRDPGDDDRALTTNVLDAYSSPTLALSNEVNTGTEFDPSSIQFPTKEQIALAVWNYGKESGVANQTGRSLSSTAIVNSNGNVSKYIGTLSSSSNTIDAAVWSSNDKTLSSASVDDGTAIATTTDIPSIENLTSMLTKIFGVLCHWELDGDSILVKNDAGSTILTIPTTKDKYGDIIRMDGTSEELQ